jgi:alpha-tubulin suppressor-like RCC1 family protein
VCWGANTAGQAGQGNVDPVAPPQAVQGSSGAPLLPVREIACGGDFTCAALRDGTAWCWGDPVLGSLGNGAAAGQPVTQAAPVDSESGTSSLTSVAHIAAGGAHACAALDDGALVCWGANLSNQVAPGSTDPQPLPLRVMVPPVVRPALGDHFSCALGADGSVWCWGLNDDGQLGSPTEEKSSATPLRVPLSCP